MLADLKGLTAPVVPGPLSRVAWALGRQNDPLRLVGTNSTNSRMTATENDSFFSDGGALLSRITTSARHDLADTWPQLTRPPWRTFSSTKYSGAPRPNSRTTVSRAIPSASRRCCRHHGSRAYAWRHYGRAQRLLELL